MDHAGFSPAVVTVGGKPGLAAIDGFFAGVDEHSSSPDEGILVPLGWMISPVSSLLLLPMPEMAPAGRGGCNH